MVPRRKKVELRSLNPHLVCTLCSGYKVDATALVECLHTFCRGCIIRYLKRCRFCPICEVQANKLNPKLSLRPDHTLQMLIYKVVPNLYHSEMTRRAAFRDKYYKVTTTGAAICPEDLPETEIKAATTVTFLSPEERISLSLEYDNCISNANSLVHNDKLVVHKRYLQCPAAVTVYHLKKFVRMKYDLGPNHEVDIMYDSEVLDEDFSLMDIAYIFHWEAKSPMRFSYRIRVKSMALPSDTQAPQREPVAANAPATPSPHVPKTTKTRQGVASSGSSDESQPTQRRQQRQRTAKTAAYNAMEAMEDDITDVEEQDADPEPTAKRQRKSYKSPRWESEDTPRLTRGKTPRASAVDADYRYYTKPTQKRVYHFQSYENDEDYADDDNDDSSSDSGFSRRMKISASKPKSLRKRAADIYDFQTSGNEIDCVDEEDSVNSAASEKFSNCDFIVKTAQNVQNGKKVKPIESRVLITDHDYGKDPSKMNGANNAFSTSTGEESVDSTLISGSLIIDSDSELEKDIEMEVIDYFIENGIEEVEEDEDLDKSVADVPQETNGNNVDVLQDAVERSVEPESLIEEEVEDQIEEDIEAEYAVPNQVIQVEDDLEHELRKIVGECSGRSGLAGTAKSTADVKKDDKPFLKDKDQCKTRSSTVDEEEALEIVHEKVMRKKNKHSKQSKHHHHHRHHHRHKHRKSPELVPTVVSSPEETPMKLTLKLRPTPSISPGSSNSSKSSRSPIPVNADEPFYKIRRVEGNETSPITVDEGDDCAVCDSTSKTIPKSPTSLKPSSSSLDKKSSQKITHSGSTSPNSLQNSIVSPIVRSMSSTDQQLTDTKKNTSPRECAVTDKSKTQIAKPKAVTCSVSSSTVMKPPVAPISKSLSQVSKTPLQKSPSLQGESPPRPPTPMPFQSQIKTETKPIEKKALSECVKEKLGQMRAIRPKVPQNTINEAKLEVKTPPSLTISKISSNEPRPRNDAKDDRPALEILMLPPSPPPLKAVEIMDSGKPIGSLASTKTLSSSVSIPKSPQSSSNPSTLSQHDNLVTKKSTNEKSAPPRQHDDVGALDLSGRKSTAAAPVSSKGNQPSVMPKTSVMPTSKKSTNNTSTISQSSTQRRLQTPNRDTTIRTTPQDTTLVTNAPLLSFRMRNLITLADQQKVTTTVMSNSQNNKLNAIGIPGTLIPVVRLPLMPKPTFETPLGQRSKPMPALNELFPARRQFGASTSSSTPRMHIPNILRPGPNQSVRHIPNPSALLQRQKQEQEQRMKHAQILADLQLADRLKDLQHNMVVTSSSNNNVNINNNNSIQKLHNMRPVVSLGGGPMSRSIEKVAAGLTMRAVEARAGK